MKIDLSICIVSWNTETLLKECLRSIFERTKGISCEVFVVDNASKDGTVKMVREHFSDVSLIVNHEIEALLPRTTRRSVWPKGDT